MSTRRVTVGMLIREALEVRLAELHVSMPCKVLSYNASRNTVNLQPLLKRRRRKKDGTKTATKIESLQNVPVAFMRVGGAWITLPIAAGDVGMVTFAERSLKDWLSKSAGEEVEPTDETLHPLSGAWFYPGGYPAASPIDSPNTSHPVFHTASELHLGEKGLSGDQFVAIAKLVSDALDTLKNAISTAAVAPMDGGATFKTNIIASLSAWPPNLAATKVKAK